MGDGSPGVGAPRPIRRGAVAAEALRCTGYEAAAGGVPVPEGVAGVAGWWAGPFTGPEGVEGLVLGATGVPVGVVRPSDPAVARCTTAAVGAVPVARAGVPSAPPERGVVPRGPSAVPAGAGAAAVRLGAAGVRGTPADGALSVPAAVAARAGVAPRESAAARWTSTGAAPAGPTAVRWAWVTEALPPWSVVGGRTGPDTGAEGGGVVGVGVAAAELAPARWTLTAGPLEPVTVSPVAVFAELVVVEGGVVVGVAAELPELAVARWTLTAAGLPEGGAVLPGPVPVPGEPVEGGVVVGVAAELPELAAARWTLAAAGPPEGGAVLPGPASVPGEPVEGGVVVGVAAELPELAAARWTLAAAGPPEGGAVLPGPASVPGEP
ncbi:hypothetical protein ACFYSQ_24975, partial [Streptomyces sp. NPDC006285]